MSADASTIQVHRQPDSFITSSLEGILTEEEFWVAIDKNARFLRPADVKEKIVKDLDDGGLDLTMIKNSGEITYLEIYTDLEKHEQKVYNYFDAKHNVPESITTIRTLTSPLRVELQRKIAGRRAAGPGVCSIVKTTLKGVFDHAGKPDQIPDVKNNQESPTDAGELSVLSEAFVDDMSPEVFFGIFRKLMQDGWPALPGREAFELKPGDDDDHFETMAQYGGQKFFNKYEMNPKECIIRVHCRIGDASDSAKLDSISVTKLLKDPVRLESYSLVQEKHVVGEVEADLLLRFTTKALETAKS